MKTTETLDVEIHDVAFGGAGVARLPDGKVVFVPDTITGEKVRIELTRSRKGFSQGECVVVLQSSPHRVEPPCPYFGSCGGCQYQHIGYEEQVRIKAKQVRDVLQRIGKMSDLPDLEIHPASQPLGYRNKITLHTNLEGDLGFFARDGRTVVNIDACLIAKPTLNEKLSSCRNASSHPRHLTLVDETVRIDKAEGVFHQVNDEMSAKLIAWIRGKTGAPSDRRLVDLYAGTGFFALGMSDLFFDVTAVEANPHAVHYGSLEARKKEISNVSFFAGKVEEQLKWLMDGRVPQQTVVLVDPPREGLDTQVIDILLKYGVNGLIYISCDPATLARDLKRLAGEAKSPYVLKALGMFDMFPQTSQIEVAAILSARNS